MRGEPADDHAWSISEPHGVFEKGSPARVMRNQERQLLDEPGTSVRVRRWDAFDLEGHRGE